MPGQEEGQGGSLRVWRWDEPGDSGVSEQRTPEAQRAAEQPKMIGAEGQRTTPGALAGGAWTQDRGGSPRGSADHPAKHTEQPPHSFP